MAVYFQITSRCNMLCPHCFLGCTEFGDDMTLEIFKKSLQLGEALRAEVWIGGGEPTIHPMFWDFMAVIDGCEYLNWLTLPNLKKAVIVGTNGSMTETAIRLSDMGSRGEIVVHLSLSKYHRPLDPGVLSAFATPSEFGQPFFHTYNLQDRDFRVILGESPGLINTGRAKSLTETKREYCAGDLILITPLGDIRPCACVDAPILGNVNLPISESFIRQLQSQGGMCFLGRQTISPLDFLPFESLTAIMRLGFS